MTTYITRQGDMWDLISFRLCGTSEQVTPLMQANLEYADVFIFPAGVTLNVPELNSVVDYSAIPPWKRV